MALLRPANSIALMGSWAGIFVDELSLNGHGRCIARRETKVHEDRIVWECVETQMTTKTGATREH